MTDKLYFHGLKENGEYAFRVKEILDSTTQLNFSRESRGLSKRYERVIELAVGQKLPIRDDRDPAMLAEAGWGLIIPEKPSKNYEDLLRPLLDKRREQAGALFKILKWRQGESAVAFMERYGSELPPVDPEKLPYFLLIAAGLEEIPLEFQYELDVQYSVGRVTFSEDQAYRNFAQNVLLAEKKTDQDKSKTTWFGTKHQGDRPTAASFQHLIKEMHQQFSKKTLGEIYGQDQIAVGAATKSKLNHILHCQDPPDVLFTAAHSMAFPPDSPYFQAWQGAIICDDLQSMEDPIGSNHIFGAGDISRQGNQEGMVAFLFGCFTAATPKFSDFPDGLGEAPIQVGPCSTVSPLAERLLGKNNGCSVVIGHVDSAYPWSFTNENAEPHLNLYRQFFERVCQGHRVGHAMESFHLAFAECQVHWERLQNQMRYEEDFTPDKNLVAKIWRRINDTRNYIILGDPAVAVCKYRPKRRADL